MSAIVALGIFFLAWFLLWLPVVVVVAWQSGMSWSYPISQDRKLSFLLPLYGLAPLAVWGFSRFLYPSAWSDYGLVWSPRLLIAIGMGFGIGVAGVFLLRVVELGLGWRRFSPDEEKHPLHYGILIGALLGLTLFIGGIEELVFRGVVVQVLLATVPLWGMVASASLIFAISHLVWDGPAGISQLPGLGLMGMVLILARWVNEGLLGLPWGLHTGWIFAIALLDTLKIIAPIDSAPRVLAGKSDQPLTGLPALGLLLLTGLGLWGYYPGF